MLQKLKKLLFRIIPEQSFIPVVSVLLLQLVVYCGPKLFEGGRAHLDMSTPLDGLIPFVPAFVVFYVAAFAQWLIFYLLLAREDGYIMRRYLTACVISKLFCMLVFIIFPTTMARPELTGRGPFTLLCRLIYLVDTPTNLFPSMHCVESWYCLRLALEQRRLGRVPLLISGSIKGFNGSTISFIGKRRWAQTKHEFVSLGEGHRIKKLVRGPRKWTLKANITALPENVIEYDEVFIKAHTFTTCVFSVFVVLSTLFIKQHLVVDAVMGILVTELSLLASKLINNTVS